MIEIVHDATEGFANTIPLDSLLAIADLPFRSAVLGALISEGFEIEEPLPSLQHPKDMLESIGWLGEGNFGASWEAFHQSLLLARKLGILVDVSIRQTRRHPLESAHVPDHLATA